MDKNKLSLTLKDYTCVCGYVNASSFSRNIPYVRCNHCHAYSDKNHIKKY